MPNHAALTARSTDVNSSSSEASVPIATDLFFWNKNIVMKFLPAPSETLKLKAKTGCLIIHPNSMDRAQLSTATFAYLYMYFKHITVFFLFLFLSPPPPQTNGLREKAVITPKQS